MKNDSDGVEKLWELMGKQYEEQLNAAINELLPKKNKNKEFNETIEKWESYGNTVKFFPKGKEAVTLLETTKEKTDNLAKMGDIKTKLDFFKDIFELRKGTFKYLFILLYFESIAVFSILILPVFAPQYKEVLLNSTTLNLVLNATIVQITVMIFYIVKSLFDKKIIDIVSK